MCTQSQNRPIGVVITVAKVMVCLIMCFIHTKFTKLQAQSRGNIDRYNTSNGMPNNIVLSIFQDRKGFLWIGTYNNLCRYDGRDFKVYKNLSSSQDGIHSVNVITQDNEDNIWIGTRGGSLASLNQATQEWKEYMIQNDYVTAIYCATDNVVWIGTGKGYIKKMERGKLMQVAKVEDGISKISMLNDSELLLISTLPYILSIHTAKITYAAKKIDIPGPQAIVNYLQNYNYLAYSNPGGNELTIYNTTNQKKVSYSTNKDLPNYFAFYPSYITQNNNFIIAGKAKLYEYSTTGELLENITLAELPEKIDRTYVNTIFVDNSGLIWMGTNEGLIKIDKHRFQFSRMTANIGNKELKYNYVRSLYSQANELWIGAKNGEICKISKDTAGRTLKKTWYKANFGTGVTSDNYTINSIIVNNKGDVWAGGRGGLFLMRAGSNVFKQLTTGGKSDQGIVGDVWGLYIDDKQNLLVGASDGMFVLNQKTRFIKPCKLGNKNVDFSVWNIYRSKKNQLWVGCKEGIFFAQWSAVEGTYVLNRYMNTPLDGRDVWSIAEDSIGNLWFGSTSKGILYMDLKQKKYKLFTKDDGLADNITSGIIYDRSGNIWISTISGLSKYDVKNKRFINFNEEDGLSSDDFNFKAYCASPWGELYFGTKSGITCFFPEKISNPEKSEDPIYITNLKIKGVDYPLLNQGEALLQLPYNNNNISVQFALLDYRKTFTHAYRYILEGFDKGWVYTTHDNPTATYTNLRPGNYIFVVQGSKDGKVWSNSKAKLSFTIGQAWWQHLYVWALAFTFILLLTGYIIRRRIKQLLKKEREKAHIQKAMADLEMKVLRAQMNPHFLFNAVVGIQNYILKNDIAHANEYLSRFAKLMRLFLQSSRSVSVVLAKEIEMLELYVSLEKIRFNDKFDYTFNIDKSLPLPDIKIPSLMLQPFVENAVNHGLVNKETKGWLEITFKYTDNNSCLMVVIEDNGIGREKARQIAQENKPEHISTGMKIVEERIDTFFRAEDYAINMDVIDKYNNKNEAEGTRVTIKIPIIIPLNQTSQTDENTYSG